MCAIKAGYIQTQRYSAAVITTSIINISGCYRNIASCIQLYCYILTCCYGWYIIIDIDNMIDVQTDIQAGSEEVATMMLRNVYQNLGSVETEHIDEAVLDNIFSNFCIGK